MRAVVLGANGQDGINLTRILSQRDIEVFGFVRSDLKVVRAPNTHYIEIDLTCQDKLFQIFKKINADRIYHVAAVHGSAGKEYETNYGDAISVNVTSVHTALEYIRVTSKDCRMFYASSGKVFGDHHDGVVNETSKLVSPCLYSASKNFAGDILKYYRKNHGIKVSQCYLFNHESRYRTHDYFIPKIIDGLLSALRGSVHRCNINSLEFHGNWGCAKEYMEICVAALEVAPKEDFILGFNKTWYARDLVEELFQYYNLDYRDYITENNRNSVTSDGTFTVDTGKLNSIVKKTPRTGIIELCRSITDFHFAAGTNCPIKKDYKQSI